MRIRKTISKPIRVDEDGVQVVGGVNATVAANVAEGGRRTSVSSRQKVRITQRDGRTEVVEEHETTEGTET